jgi:hypothetical protein
MLFFVLLIFALAAWLLPWWATFVLALIMGWVLPGGWRRAGLVALGAGLTTMAAAYVLDGRSHGLISLRMSALFSLPFSGGIFLFVGLLSAISAFLGYRCGVVWRDR